MITRDKGYILRRWNFRETSVIISIFCEHYGKISGILKGFYTYKKGFTTTLDLFTLNEIVFYPRKSELWLVSYADLIEDPSFLRSDLQKNQLASIFSRIVFQCTMLHEQNKDIFYLISNFLEVLSTSDSKLTLSIFLIQLLTLCGFKPEFNKCLHCHRPFTSTMFFSTREGGLLCSRCGYSKHDARAVNPEVSAVIRYIQNYSVDASLRIKCSVKGQNEIFLLLGEFLKYHLQFDLTTYSRESKEILPAEKYNVSTSMVRLKKIGKRGS